ncbi:MAG: 1-acyl-sn-glycerol-3-phosphate acyltransferase [Deltaproteobacteria bacterium]|nr:1-acyl-sn-glycerol-3-phosphate acyltransferase [Deltaproteobacteria bacterium]
MLPVRAPLRASGLAIYTLARLATVTAHERLVAEQDRPVVFDKHMRAWCRRLLKMFGMQVIVDPAAPPAATGARLVVANHRSPADIIVLLTLFGGQFLGQAAIARWPILGTAARKAGTVWVERSRGTSGASAIRVIRRRLEQGATLLVFPEGTTFAGDEVREFRQGAFSAMRGLDVEVIPVGLAYDAGVEWVDESFLAHLQKMASRKSTKLVVKVGSPIRVKAGESRADLTTRLHDVVQGLVHEARAIHEA